MANRTAEELNLIKAFVPRVEAIVSRRSIDQDDVVVWTVRHARAVMRMLPHSRELRGLIGAELGLSRPCRHEDARALREFAAGTWPTSNTMGCSRGSSTNVGAADS